MATTAATPPAAATPAASPIIPPAPTGERPLYELLDNGDIVKNGRKGKPALLAKYDEETKTLTFESESMDAKYRSPILRAVAETPDGEPTGYAVGVFAVKGREADEHRKGEPPHPKINKQLGDKTPEFVKWLFKWRPQSFYARYGVLLDANGEPKTAHCLRVEQGLLEEDTGKALVIRGDGKDALAISVLEREDGMLARQKTCLTFTVDEIVNKDDPNADEADDSSMG